MPFKKCELLAPAGSIDALKAAVYAGADAVYFGGGGFNARAFAKNFDGNDLKDAFDICRCYGVKAYITLNTVLTDRELPQALDFAAELEALYKPDAYIVQDVGLITELKAKLPGIPLHASTQMQLHSSLSVAAAKRLGLERIVFARELSKADMQAVTAADIEVELFAHGALCVCQSGGCLMSSFIGGRSGNRGRCAQPCRQSYNGTYPLSLKDMCYASHIPELCKMGVDSLKIEGRMKSPQYVYETVRIYRTLLDECRPATQNELERLSALFSRSGFSDGYYTASPSKAMFGIRTETDKESTRSLSVDIKEKKLPVKITASFCKDCEAYICAECGGTKVEAHGSQPLAAKTAPLTVEALSERLAKTGNTFFAVEACSLSVDDGLMLPVSAINKMRRDVLEALKQRLVASNTPVRSEAVITPDICIKQKDLHKQQAVVARFEGHMPTAKALEMALSVCDRVDLPLWLPLPQAAEPSKISLVLPRAVFDRDTVDIKKLIAQAYACGIRQLTVPNLGMLPLCDGFVVHGDYTLNVTNSVTARRLLSLGFDTVTISPEVMPGAITDTTDSAEYIVYGNAPLMHTETCIISNVSPCKDGACHSVLKDKTGAEFPIMREYGHRNTVYNSVPTYLLDKRDNLKGISLSVLMFTVESEKEVCDVLEAYQAGAIPKKPITRAAFKRSKEKF